MTRMARLSDVLREHFDAPRNAAPLEQVDARGEGTNPACGDVLHIELAADGDRIAGIAFRARACSAVIACASLITEAAAGRTLAEAAALDVEALVREAGGVPREKRHAPRVVERALRGALGSLTSG
jgi:NifU-like protein involved in Fe-S cluster formation